MVGTSTEAWTLTALVYRDLDDGDYQNALFLAERLYAIDKKNEHYTFLYAKCLYHNLDYMASYSILRSFKSIPCLKLFAETCIKLSNNPNCDEGEKCRLRNEGVDALSLALSSKDLLQKVYWGDVRDIELASTSIRHHLPSKASLCTLLADLYIKLDNIKAAAKYLWICLESNPYKITAYNRLCDIAPDCIDFNTAKLPKHVFTCFEEPLVDLNRNPDRYLSSAVPKLNVSDIQFSSKIEEESGSVESNYYSMPNIRYSDNISTEQLRSLVNLRPKLIDDDAYEIRRDNSQSELEHIKNSAIQSINLEIRKEKETKARYTKGGLYPTKADDSIIYQSSLIQLPQSIDYATKDDTKDNDDVKIDLDTVKKNGPPKLATNRIQSDDDYLPKKEEKFCSNIIDQDSVKSYFLPQSNNQVRISQEVRKHIVQGMNKAVLELNQLDDCQYDSPRVLCMLGKTYYDTTDYETARLYFKHVFVTAPWFCNEASTYSTCLCYLDLSTELNILAYKLSHNPCHQYEAYITAGNWHKMNSCNSAMQWFQKAIELDPSRSYAYMLVGYENIDKDNCLNAKSYFAKCKDFTVGGV
ncbi:hypothetical protein INT48_000701 [Thamnidium elegans]|uniref:Uncharacterized protein n=1 Tax=Thamnidium elegans TaxID=101142 RepID=A0A8H7SYD6_9FUNG|nr:hypothetical protein INT48_000701 [Thamnidium elegans]